MAKKSRNSNSESSIIQKQYQSLHQVHPKNAHQKQYLEGIANNTITISIGPAGSGKTYLAVYAALCHLWDKKQTNIKRIVISRPAVEAGGEKIGFLPGSLGEKMDPYMRPIYDALFDIAGINTAREKIERGYIEVAPLAFMRGRTFNDTFVILDEAQNASLEQLKMVLTRLGENSKLVINGDPSQSDIIGKKQNDLLLLEDVLKKVPDLSIIKFNNEDIVRNKVVSNIVLAFEKYNKKT